MKNTGLKLLVLLASTSLLASCGGKSSDTPKADPYKDVNESLEKVYVSFDMTVKTVGNGTELNSRYSFAFNGAYYVVNYEVEKLNELSADTSTSQKTTETGSYNVNVEEATLAKFKVSDETFTNIEYQTGVSFTGTAKDGKAYLGVSYEVNNLALTVTLDEGLTKVEYTYSVSSGAQNIVTYSNFVE
mgnify:CR=1 FL=1